jgi:hypothetical protein
VSSKFAQLAGSNVGFEYTSTRFLQVWREPGDRAESLVMTLSPLEVRVLKNLLDSGPPTEGETHGSRN